MSRLAVLLAGRAAEQIALGELSTGAQNDLQWATGRRAKRVSAWGSLEPMRGAEPPSISVRGWGPVRYEKS